MCYTKEGTLRDRREMLRVKIKSLADEARIIRKEETRTNGTLREELHMHRIGTVRYEARATHLAYGLIRGRTLDRIEKPTTPRPDHLWDKVRGMVKKYGPVSADANKQLLERCSN
jgi:hypothetical protein